jgi:hypothetical protein
MEQKPELLKQAAAMLKTEHGKRLELEKRAHAEKLAFRKVELGITEPFSSYEDFRKEAAAIEAEGDLALVEKALEYGTLGGHRSGTLEKQASSERGSLNPIEHLILHGELSE